MCNTNGVVRAVLVLLPLVVVFEDIDAFIPSLPTQASAIQAELTGAMFDKVDTLFVWNVPSYRYC